MSRSAPFSALAETLETVKGTSSKNKKVKVLASFISALSPEDAEVAARIATGRASVRGSREEVQVGYSTLLDVIQEISGATRPETSKVYLKYGDLGEVAQTLLRTKRETTLFAEPLRISDLEDAFDRMRSAKGKGAAAARRNVVKSLLLRASPLEAKFIVKVLTGEMRTGLVHGLLEDAIAEAHGLPEAEVARAHLLLGDIGLLAGAAARGELRKVKMTPFRPVNFMLAEPMATSGQIAEHFGKEVYAEFKYDGVRAQIHKLGDAVKVYSRRLEQITTSFPEVAEAAGEVAHDFVMDGETVPFKDGGPLPFQLLQRRLRRQENFEEAAKNAPVTYFAFDLLLLDGEELCEKPLSGRSERLSKVLEGSRIPTAERSLVKDPDEIDRVFRKSRDLGYEGLVLKDPTSVYTMGKRGMGWVKMKEELDTIDAVIVAAEYGHGKRAGVISDYTFAVREGDSLKTIGKAYSGLTDKEIEQMTAKLKEITIKDYGYRRLVKPEIVIEVAFDSIQQSDRHDSGFALRFPRIKRIREDKSPSDTDDLDKVKKIFQGQRVKLGEA